MGFGELAALREGPEGVRPFSLPFFSYVARLF